VSTHELLPLCPVKEIEPSGPEAVLPLARKSWLVLPIHTATDCRCSCRKSDCDSIGKHPRTTHGLNDATSDEAQIALWSQRFPACNWAVRTGEESGIFVLDVDGKAGAQSLAALEQTHGDGWLQTLRGKTPHGTHVYFRYPTLAKGFKVKCSAGEVAAGLDIRGAGGYVLVSPSKLPDGDYAWANDLAIANAPDWLLELVLVKEQPPSPQAPSADGHGDVIPAGKRNVTLTSLAGTMRRRAMSPDAIEAALLKENKKCRPPLSADEISRIAGSVGSYPPAMASGEEWRKELLVTAGGEPKALLANAVMLLRHASEFAGVLSFDEFSLQVATARKAPWPESVAGAIWTDDDDTRAACWLQRQGVTVSSKVAAEAVQTVAKENRFHPIKRYLESLSWDQSPRLDTWLAEYLGAENSALHSAIGAKWMISGCARIYQPGCQADHTLLLEGPQGARKSTTLRTLAGDEYFADHLSDLGSKDSRIELLGRWIIEMSEFTSRRSELERKSFLTSRADSFRAPYERRARLVPRTCIFAATSNDPVPLTDESGGRRYWCVTVGKIDIEKLRADRDQLWAEAHTRYLAGESWYPDSLEFQAALTTSQAARYQEGPHDEAILAWLENPQPRQFNNHIDRNSLPFDSTPERVTLIDVLIHAVGMAQHAIAQKDQYPVIRCLRHAGWKNKQIRIAGTRRNVRFWEKDSML
jgi:predicted P-loop ATPase